MLIEQLKPRQVNDFDDLSDNEDSNNLANELLIKKKRKGDPEVMVPSTTVNPSKPKPAQLFNSSEKPAKQKVEEKSSNLNIVVENKVPIVNRKEMREIRDKEKKEKARVNSKQTLDMLGMMLGTKEQSRNTNNTNNTNLSTSNHNSSNTRKMESTANNVTLSSGYHNTSYENETYQKDDFISKNFDEDSIGSDSSSEIDNSAYP